MRESRDVILELVETLAEVEGADIHGLEYTLHDHVDTEAIERLVGMDAEDWTLTFEVPDHEVTIEGGGRAGVGGVRGDEPRRVDDGVRDLERALDVRGEVGHPLAGRVAVQRFDWNPDLLTGRPLGLEVVGVVLGELDEQPAGVADAGPGDVLEYPVFGDALLGTDPVRLGVAGTAVEQSVRAPGGAACQAATFDERHVDTAEREVTSDASAGRAAADDEGVRINRHVYW